MAANDWIYISDQLPPEGKVVLCTTESGDVRELVFERNLFWLPDMSMYVYFTPVKWCKK